MGLAEDRAIAAVRAEVVGVAAVVALQGEAVRSAVAAPRGAGDEIPVFPAGSRDSDSVTSEVP